MMEDRFFKTLFDLAKSTTGKTFGFRYGDKGTHSSRTIMLDELQKLFDSVPGPAERDAYIQAVIDDNCLGKRTAATKRLSLQRLSELYGLDPEVPLFRVMRDLWSAHAQSRPMLALLLALARDPLLRMTAKPVVETPFGKEFARQSMTDALAEGTGGRFNATILDKVVRNASSSWTQSGHLQGRARKFRQQAKATPASCAYALLLGFMQGVRGPALYECPWARLLDLTPPDVRELADDARRLGMIDIKESGTIVDISFPYFLTREERELLHGPH